MRARLTIPTLVLVFVSGMCLASTQSGTEVRVLHVAIIPLLYSFKLMSEAPANILPVITKPFYQSYEKYARKAPGGTGGESSKKQSSSLGPNSNKRKQAGATGGRDKNIKPFGRVRGQLKTALQKIGTQLKEKPDIVLILSLDLDGTTIYNVATKHQAEKQQSLLDMFNKFASEHDNLLIIFNTARDNSKFAIESPKEKSCLFSWLGCKPAGLEEIKLSIPGNVGDAMTAHLFNPKRIHKYTLAYPDILISDGGSVIALKPGTSLATNTPALDEMNRALHHWLSRDLSCLCDNPEELQKIPHDLIDDLWETPLNIPLTIPVSKINLEGQLCYDQLQLVPYGDIYAKNYLLSGIRINKGTALRMVLAYLADFLKGRQGILVTAGDALIDMPMLRPDLEAEAIENIRADQRDEREQSIQNDIKKTKVPALSDPGYLRDGNIKWLSSVLICHDSAGFTNLCKYSTPHVKQSLAHEKVVTVQGSLPSLMGELFEGIANTLEQYLNPSK